MKLFSTKPKQETSVVHDHMGKRSWRWNVEITPFYLNVYEEMSYEKNQTWCLANRYFEICFDKKFLFGRFHFWHDGPHDTLRLGWIVIAWSGSCQKCHDSV
jgi:hypothetical protein